MIFFLPKYQLFRPNCFGIWVFLDLIKIITSFYLQHGSNTAFFSLLRWPLTTFNSEGGRRSIIFIFLPGFLDYVKGQHHAAASGSSEESAAAALWELSTADHAETRGKGWDQFPQGLRRIKSKSSGLRSSLRGASSLQDTKRQGAGDSTRDWVGWALGRDGSNSFLNPDT